MKNTMFRSLLGLAALSLLVMGASGCDEDGTGDDGCVGSICAGDLPIIDTNKDTITFNVVEIGNSADDVFRISNQGTGTLLISDMQLTGPDAGLFTINTGRDAEYVSGTEIVIAPKGETGTDNFTDIQIVFTPEDVGSAQAELLIFSNDPNHNAENPYTIRIQALETGPQPQVDPNPIVFGQVLGGETVRQDVVITNVGSAPLQIEDVYLTGSPDFAPETGAGTQDNQDVWHVTFPRDAIEVGGNFDFKLTYAPPTQGPDKGELVIEYLFGEQTREHRTEINANGADPCIRLEPSDVVDFGQSVIGKTKSQQVIVQNCGTEDLTIYDIYLTADSDTEVFSVTDLPAEIQAEQDLVLRSGSSRTFFVVFAPFAESTHTGTLIFESDALNQETRELPITGTGSTNNCPTAVAKARVRDLLNPNAPYFTDLTAEPLDYLELTAAESSDPDGDQITDYVWTVVKAPEGFSLSFERSNREVDPQIQLALIGDYIFELNVTDENGAEACEKARVTVQARSDKDLIVELTWRTPADPDETRGQGTDLDLHFLEPGGTWNDYGFFPPAPGSDCYFLNLRPDWQTPKQCTDSFDENNVKIECCTLAENRDDPGCVDNPNLDRDDTDGGGPEQVNIRTPAATDGSGSYNLPYTVGAYYYAAPAPVLEGVCSNDASQTCEIDNDCGGGNTCDEKRCVEWCSTSLLATVRVFLLGSQVPAVVWPSTTDSGELARELINFDENERNGDFWVAGEIDWDGTTGQPNERDELYTGFPDPGCSPVCDADNRCACQ